jgi:hypothetical protein
LVFGMKGFQSPPASKLSSGSIRAWVKAGLSATWPASCARVHDLAWGWKARSFSGTAWRTFFVFSASA